MLVFSFRHKIRIRLTDNELTQAVYTKAKSVVSRKVFTGLLITINGKKYFGPGVVVGYTALFNNSYYKITTRLPFKLVK